MSKPSIRCAIYTRKSSEEGLDQEFNSLDAQYEACASYIASQRHEGWKPVKDRYDDGGISGGTLERPALNRLMADIDAGRIRMIVVYKIDRLTRSLADFARLVERLEAAGCSFVSITQAFNTSSSMGRLTLNVLLSFAQFEREVTAERIRDKIAASKKKGLWMGGVCPLGYDRDPDPDTRTLVVNHREASKVNKLFELYDQHGCLKSVEQEAQSLNLRSKRHVYTTGRVAGDKPFSRGQIYHILRTPVYLGLIRHKDQTYPGQHPAILEEVLWERVQEKLISAGRRSRGRTSSGDPAAKVTDQAVLTGRMFDETGDRLTPTHTTRRGRKLRYYVSNRLISGGIDPSGWRLPAPKLEEQVATVVADHIETHASNYTLTVSPDIRSEKSVKEKAGSLIKRLRTDGLSSSPDLVDRIDLRPDRLLVRLNAENIVRELGVEVRNLSGELAALEVPWQFRRRGVEAKIIVGNPAPEPDQTLIRMLSLAHQWLEQVKAGLPLKQIARKQGVTPAYIRTRTKLAFLSPKIQQAIVAGNFPPAFTTNRILQAKIPLDWREQDTLFGV
ncbi:MAG: recombinase family protein [Alphaproteobacteria bacterium]|nr:recombinase family protein [Alphaproteobacteria bacterium]